MPTTSLDDVLIAAQTKKPLPDPIQQETPQETVQETPQETEDIKAEVPANEYGITQEISEETKQETVADEYGNERPAPKTYTEDEVNERINMAVRERLARLERNGAQGATPQQVQQQVQQAQQGFNYDENNPESWQQQLESFIEQTHHKIAQKQSMQAQQVREQQAQSEFEFKFQEGMKKFTDFRETVGTQPISDAMMVATRGMKDPAAFLYAASKRAPQELQRIATISDPYSQMVEMGKLEERMKQSKPTTKTPKPIGKTPEDLDIPVKSNKPLTIEDMIARDAAKRLAMQKQRRN